MANLTYDIALINVWWQQGGVDTRLFESVKAQDEYFENKIKYSFKELVNFNIGDNVNTTVVVNYGGTNTPQDVPRMVASNYAVVRGRDGGNNIVFRRYYYAKCSQLSGTQLRVELNLDVIQTHYIGNQSRFKGAWIKRAHLNRWRRLTTFDFEFDATPQSKLFEDEGIFLPKRLTRRTKLVLSTSREGEGYSNKAMDEWLSDNVKYWVYTYIKCNQSYKIGDEEITIPPTYYGDRGLREGTSYDVGYRSGWSILCYPVYKEGQSTSLGRLFIKSGVQTVALSSQALDVFRKDNNDASYFYSSKISCIFPFKLGVYSFNIDSNNNLTIELNDTDVQLLKMSGVGLLNIRVSYPNEPITTYEYSSNQRYQFTVAQIQGNRSRAFNPKILSGGFKQLRLTNGVEGLFNYDFQKLGVKEFRCLIYEPLFPDITRQFIAIIPPDNCIYTKDTLKNYTGIVASIDNQLPFDNDKLQEFLANNKNFFLSRKIETVQDSVKLFNSFKNGIITGASQIGSGELAKGGATLSGTVDNTITGAMDIYFKRVNSNLTLDNMDNSPVALTNANGNAIFNESINQPGIYVEEYEAIENEQASGENEMYKFGYAYNQSGPLEEFDNIRVYFNYLEADVDIIQLNISNLERELLKQRLKSIRFWNSDDIQYSKENYERTVKNG